MFYQIFFIDDHNEGTQITQMADKVFISHCHINVHIWVASSNGLPSRQAEGAAFHLY